MEFESSKKASHRIAALGAAAVAVFTVGCAQANTATGATTSTTLTGTLVPMGSVSQSVTVTGNGEMDVQIASFTPQTTITLGLGIGQTLNGQCALLTYAENMKVSSVLSEVVAPGTYCVLIYDVGNVVGTDAFTLTVSSPT